MSKAHDNDEDQNPTYHNDDKTTMQTAQSKLQDVFGFMTSPVDREGKQRRATAVACSEDLFAKTTFAAAVFPNVPAVLTLSEYCKCPFRPFGRPRTD